MNTCTFVGNLTRDVTQHSAQTTEIYKAGIAVNKRGKDGTDQTLFLDLKFFGARGAAFARFHNKGALVCVSGELEHQRWTDRDSGEKRERYCLLVSNWTFVGERKSARDAEPEPDPITDYTQDNTPF